MSRSVLLRRGHPVRAAAMAVQTTAPCDDLARDATGSADAVDGYGCFDFDLFGPPVPGAASQLGPMSTPFTK